MSDERTNLSVLLGIGIANNVVGWWYDLLVPALLLSTLVMGIMVVWLRKRPTQ